MTAPSPADRLYRIVEDGMCIGCGLCQAVAGGERVRVERVESGYECPVVVGPLDDATVDRVWEVCPGTRLEGLPERLVDAATRHDLVWGPWRRIVLAWAAEPELRHRGATGGVLTALARYLLASKRVGFVLHVKAGGASPACGQPQLSFDASAVLEGAGSRYGPAAPLRHVDRALERGEPFAFIGKPCDVAALRNLARVDPRVDALVRYWLAPVCGGYMAPEGLRRFLDERGIDPDTLTALRYRGFGCPGPTRIETSDGRVEEVHYLDFWGEDASTWVLPFRCKVCPDGIGEAADLAAADTWPGGSPDRRESETDPGTNALVIRTAAGAELVDAAARDGALCLGQEQDPRYMDAVQPHQRRKKLVVRARWDGLVAEGRIVPRAARLRLNALARAHGAAENLRQTEGTRRRVREGKTSQPRPSAGRTGAGPDGSAGR